MKNRMLLLIWLITLLVSGCSDTAVKPPVTADLDLPLQTLQGEEVNLNDYAGKVILVNFWATWCGPCKLVAPSMVWAADAFDGNLKVVKIDCTDGNKELMEKYNVYGLPCLMVFRDGDVVEGSHREGAITKKALGEYIEKHCGLVSS